MNTNTSKDFDKEAAEWDSNPGRVKLAHDVGAAMIKEINFTNNMEVIDFGCGTGLLTLKLQPLVKKITGIDNSRGMLTMLENKVKSQKLGNVNTQYVDFDKGHRIEGLYDVVVSSMVLHHIPESLAVFKEWISLLRPNGQVCFADLDTEDGGFHGDNTGVHHRGFDRAHLKQLLLDAGFSNVRDSTATTVIKQKDAQSKLEFPIFLITAMRK